MMRTRPEGERWIMGKTSLRSALIRAGIISHSDERGDWVLHVCAACGAATLVKRGAALACWACTRGQGHAA